MIAVKKNEYDMAIQPISKILPALAAVPGYIKKDALEIRIRTGQPILIRLLNGNFAIQAKADSASIENCISAFCKNSVHSYEKEIAEGYITLEGGHRAGFCGTAVYTGGRISFIKNISSINIRIARQHCGCADMLASMFITGSAPKGLLIIGKPLSGKTTVLRDLVRQISKTYTVALIDERGEIAASADGVPQLDIGVMTDVLCGYSKNDGIDRAVRTLSPRYIAMDELGFDNNKTELCLNSGVGVILTAHADSIREAMLNRGITALLYSGAISHAAFLSSEKIGQVSRIIPVSELSSEGSELCNV